MTERHELGGNDGTGSSPAPARSPGEDACTKRSLTVCKSPPVYLWPQCGGFTQDGGEGGPAVWTMVTAGQVALPRSLGRLHHLSPKLADSEATAARQRDTKTCLYFKF